MQYQTPLDDINFVLQELAGLKEILELPGFEDISEDVVEAVLQENSRFAETAVAPLNRTGDTSHPKCENGQVTTSPGFKEAFKSFAEAGWQGLNHDVQFGGQGLPKVVAAPASENLNAANLSFSLCPLLTDGVIEALSTVGSDEQKSTFIPPLIEGRWTGTMNLTEPQAGSDLSLVKTKAEPQPDGTYRISGQKIFITYGEHDMAENIVHLVLARTPNAPEGVKGISLFIVPKFLVNSDGSLGKRNDIWCASIEDKLGIRGSPTAVLLYGSGQGEVGEGAVGYLVGEENEGLKYMFIMMNAARYAVGLQGVAISEAALQGAESYAHERVQSRSLSGSPGPVTIAHHPDVQRMLSTMRALTEGSRALAYVAAAQADISRHHPDESVRKSSRAVYEFLVPVVKGFCTEMSLEVTSLGIQVYGGMGFIEETGAAQHYRDARILPIYEGTTAIQANDFLGRKLFRDAGTVASNLMEKMQHDLTDLKKLQESSDEHAKAVGLICSNFEAALKSCEKATRFLLENANNNLEAAFLGSVPYLLMSGITIAGWQMVRAAIVCINRINQGSATSFHKSKLSTCVAYSTFVLPRTHSMAAGIVAGDIAISYTKQV